jgi:histidinol-phosphate aminotransferase
MISPKKHVTEVFRTPPDKTDRSRYLRLDKNENIAELSKPRIDRILKKITPEFLASYPFVYKIQKKICDHLSFPEDMVLVTAGSDAAIKNVFEVFIEKQDEVILPDPTYAMYDVYAKLFQAEVNHIRYTDDLKLPVDKILSRIGKKTRLVVLANPDSPTGTIIPQKEILKICSKARRESAIVLIDEAYFPFYPETMIKFTKTLDNLIVTRTFSKAYGLASLRLGYAAAHPDLIRNLRIFRPMYETNGFAVLFACEVLDHPRWIEKNVRDTNAGRDYLARQMEKIGLYSYPSYANFINIRVGHNNVGPLVRYMQEKGILIKAGSDHPALRDCIRITTGPVSKMKIVENLIKKYLADNRRK